VSNRPDEVWHWICDAIDPKRAILEHLRKLSPSERALFHAAIEKDLSLSRSFPQALYVQLGRLVFHYRAKKKRMPLARLLTFTDWVPSAALRKRQRKLIADEQSEIVEFKKQGRTILASWRTVWTWIHWFRYLLCSPMAVALKLFRKMSIG
jgi:hypothetical protein